MYRKATQLCTLQAACYGMGTPSQWSLLLREEEYFHEKEQIMQFDK